MNVTIDTGVGLIVICFVYRPYISECVWDFWKKNDFFGFRFFWFTGFIVQRRRDTNFKTHEEHLYTILHVASFWWRQNSKLTIKIWNLIYFQHKLH